MAVATKAQSLELLGRVDLFQELSKADLGKILAASKEMDFTTGQDVVVQDRTGGRFFLIIGGEADVTIDGRRRGRFGPGDYFGEMALIDGLPRSATVTAKTDLTALTIASFNFRPLIREHPSLAQNLLIALSRRVRSADSTAS